MVSLAWVNATDLAQWANGLAAQADLPKLVRDLIQATAKHIRKIGFPAGEGVRLSGWDGYVEVEAGNAFVPTGMSAWELGTNQKIKSKADSDYEKRTKAPGLIVPSEATFVFVTPRRWNGKTKWAATRKGDGVWKDVRAYDADDIETWLGRAPVVHLRLSNSMGKFPESASVLESFWDDWSQTTRPATPADFVMAGRLDVADKIRTWLSDTSSPTMALQAESRDEALAIFVASFHQLPVEERDLHLSRTIIVRAESAWQQLTAFDEPLVLVLGFESSDAVPRAARRGHRVLIPLGRADSPSAATVVVPRLSREQATKALVAIGVSEDRARDLATLARKSLMAFRRELGLSSEVQQPKWATPKEGRTLLPALLAAAWSDSQEGDREALASIAGTTYEDLSTILIRWVNEDHPPVRRVGDAWFISAHEDSWSLLSRYLTRDDLRRFKRAALDVLGSPDPRFDVSGEDRWTAALTGHVSQYSSLLRKGLADSLVVIGAIGESTTLATGVTGGDYSTAIVEQLLKGANADWRLWASLSASLPVLAEAAPDAFLAAVEAGIKGERPPVLSLFADDEQVGLLWALEAIAWSPDYLNRTALLLAQLAKLDPGGRLRNRPANSLQKIFLPWYPQTSATLEQRLGVIDALRTDQPNVAWHLLRQLLPESFGIAHLTSKPRFREWVPDNPPKVTTAEYFDAIREIALRSLDDAGQCGERWGELIKSLPNLPLDLYQKALERLATIDADKLEQPDRATIWEAIRSLIARHRSFPKAKWALTEGSLEATEKILRRFEPDDAKIKYGWLFTDRPELPRPESEDWLAHEEAVARARLEAVGLLLKQEGLSGVLELVGSVKRPDELGATLAKSTVLDSDEDELLLRDYLGAEDAARAQFGRGFVVDRISSHGREWGEDKLASTTGWSADQRCALLICLPYDARTWTIAESGDPETERLYWERVYPFIPASPAEVEHVVGKLLEHGRPFTAVDLLGVLVTGGSQKPSSAVILNALESAFHSPLEDALPRPSLSHHLPALLDLLASSEDVDSSKVASLEWACLPFLGRHERTPKVLHRELARSPEFFASIIALVFLGEGEVSREVSKAEQERARSGHELLRSWRSLPGLLEDGAIDAGKLRNWVQRARALTAESKQGAIADEMIGQLLSGSPAGADGTWPHPAVRDALEDAASKDLEGGFEIGVRNGRGVVTKQYSEGGDQERRLEARYADFANAVKERWPRTAQTLSKIAAAYRREARRADQDAELREDLDR